jgi:hypothetical protein
LEIAYEFVQTACSSLAPIPRIAWKAALMAGLLEPQ